MTKLRILWTSLAALVAAVSVGCSHDSTGEGEPQTPDSAIRTVEAGSSTSPPDAAGSDASTRGGSDATEVEDGDAGAASILGEECTAACNAQNSLSCFADPASCQGACVAAEKDTENPGVSCASQYDALAVCEAVLTQWTCSMTSGMQSNPGGRPMHDHHLRLGLLRRKRHHGSGHLDGMHAHVQPVIDDVAIFSWPSHWGASVGHASIDERPPSTAQKKL
jgi:hypothetical protein